MAPLTNGAERGRRSRVVLTPRRWRQVLRSDAQSDGDNKARSPGRARRKSLKPLRAGMPGCPGEPTVTTSCALYPFCTRDCGCIKRPAFPTPFSGKAEKILHNSDAFAPRERGSVRCRRCMLVDVVIASAAKQSSFLLSLTMDCFAALAMTPTGRPGQVSSERDPGTITTESSFCADVINQHPSTRATRRMGPCVRSDDIETGRDSHARSSRSAGSR
jgi:hypothetical protein